MSLCSCPILPPAETRPGKETVCSSGRSLDEPRPTEVLLTAWIPSSPQAGGSKPVWFRTRHPRKHGVIHQDEDNAAGLTAPVTNAIKLFTAAFHTDRRFYRDHLFIKKIVPRTASLRSPLISSPVFHTVLKLISIGKIKYIHLIIPWHLTISKGRRRGEKLP